MRLADETDWPHSGVMDFVDNEIKPAYGTIRGRAIFDKQGLVSRARHFRPAALVFGGHIDALLIPDDAIVRTRRARS